MNDLTVKKAPLNWLIAGLVLGLIQILAIGIKGPLGVSTQFVIIEAKVIKAAAPQYTEQHPLISKEKYQKLGYGFWLDIGIIVGAAVAAIAVKRFKLQKTTVWWQANHGPGIPKRMITAFLGGFLILLGARFASGCTSGQFASGWAQLSLSVLPFTVGLFGAGMLTAKIFYPKSPDIE
ncbi:MAG: YeeE/YedE family protein [Sedimentisphaerales bacterium]|nr:YeeE/YedE family protein [Sedimentisphaerales bacterium]